MDKAILVIDMPNSCRDCPLVYGNDISDWCLPMGNFNGNVYGYVANTTKPNWCPLIRPPEHELLWHDDDTDDLARGFNS